MLVLIPISIRPARNNLHAAVNIFMIRLRGIVVHNHRSVFRIAMFPAFTNSLPHGKYGSNANWIICRCHLVIDFLEYFLHNQSRECYRISLMINTHWLGLWFYVLSNKRQCSEANQLVALGPISLPH